jgi:hypothetical protein
MIKLAIRIKRTDKDIYWEKLTLIKQISSLLERADRLTERLEEKDVSLSKRFGECLCAFRIGCLLKAMPKYGEMLESPENDGRKWSVDL